MTLAWLSLTRSFSRAKCGTGFSARISVDGQSRWVSAHAHASAPSPPVAAPETPTFQSLKGKVSSQTLKGLTVSPFNLDQMTPVQSLVTALLPDLAHPYDSSTPPNPDAPRDLLVRARTGTGKTLAFLIPAVEHRVRAVEQHIENTMRSSDLSSSILAARVRNSFRRKFPGALVLSPTRELATQIAGVALKLTEHHKDFQVSLFVGGESKGRQLSQWKNGHRDIVVATPGRLRDVLENHSDVRESMKSCNFLIFDEADTLLDMGFRDDIDAIVKFLAPPRTRQTFLFSATLSRRIRQIATTHLSPNHQFLDAAPPASGTDLSIDKLKDNARVPWAIDSDDELVTHAHVPQHYTPLPSPDAQIPALLCLIAHDQLIHGSKSKIIVFCPTTHSTAFFSTIMREFAADGTLPAKNTRVFEMHSKLTQAARQRASRDFRETATTSAPQKYDRRPRKGRSTPGPTVLVTSDVSARGVDYPLVTRVIQLGIPSTEALYVHRVGRTGRGLSSSPLPETQEEPPHRSDMLLLPWEAGYFSRHLHQCPIKALPLDILESQVAAAASAPSSRYSNVAIYGTSSTEGSPSSENKAPPNDNATSVDKQPDSLSTRFRSLLPLLDAEAIRQAASSLLGHYLPLAGPLHVSGQKVLSGISDWSRTFGVDMGAYAVFFVRWGEEARSLHHWVGKPSQAWLRRMGIRLEDRADSRRTRFGDLIDSSLQKKGTRRFPNQRFDKSRKDDKKSHSRDMSFRSPRVRKTSV
ncbi:P-loop containing nucleoside triphosphate hydrolase protein [Pisolithus croceorrhizus]|nr:P-loop containing nucleoside triphosphate hydrolase protein [Pisolithus croceorrhizus]